MLDGDNPESGKPEFKDACNALLDWRPDVWMAIDLTTVMWIAAGIVSWVLLLVSGFWLWLVYWKILSVWVSDFIALLIATFVPIGILIVPFIVDSVRGDIALTQLDAILLLVASIGLTKLVRRLL